MYLRLRAAFLDVDRPGDAIDRLDSPEALAAGEAQIVAADFAAARPQLDAIQSRERRWNELRLAIDPRFFTVEILYQAHRNLPSEAVLITSFLQQAGGKWTIQGEAPSANLAIEYAEKLKAEKELEAWKITSTPPAILKGEQAKFSIEGRL